MPWWLTLSGALCAISVSVRVWTGLEKPSPFWEGLLWLSLGANGVLNAIEAYGK